MDDRLTKHLNTNTERKLRRDILDTAIKGQERATNAQVELEYQGERLRRSFDNAKLIAQQATSTGRTVNQLIAVKKATRTKRIWQCCRHTCYCCCCCCYLRTKRELDNLSEGSGLIATNISAELNKSSPRENSSDTDTVVQLDSLKGALKDAKKAKGGEVPNWRKTLAPPPGASYHGNETWYRQIDASLTHLQHVAEDMGQSLDEQIKMAQMLTIYLNYGVDKVLAANENLNVEKNLF